MAKRETLSRDDDAGPRKRDKRVAQLVVLLECDRPGAASSRHVLAGIERVDIGRGKRRHATRERERLTIEVPDGRMSVNHVRLRCRAGRWVAEDSGSKNGLIVDGKLREHGVTLADGMVLELGHTLILFRESVLPSSVPADQEAIGALSTFVSSLASTFVDLAAVAQTPASILVHGETGTGKELVARSVHELANRSGAFVAINCGALPANLVEAELYGYRRGAFSGADQDRTGLVRSADRGTLFLDEIADLPLESQAALLRVLQQREVTPVGATQSIPVDLHVVAASHTDLEVQVERGAFRRDLFARLSAFTVELPPLRERREDFGILLSGMLPRLAGPNARISCAAARMLVQHDWPLNIRELESKLIVAVALARGGTIMAEHLPASVTGRQEKPPVVEPEQLSKEDRARRDDLVALLREHAGNISAVARASGKARAQIHRWLRRYQLDPTSFR